MSESKLPIIHKAPVEGLRFNIAQTGLAIGDTAEIDRLSDGRIGVFAKVRKPIFGVFSRRKVELLGHLGPMVEDLLAPPLSSGAPLRIRIVDLIPEHLSNGYPPEVYISVWGDPRFIAPFLGVPGGFLTPDLDDEEEDPPAKGRPTHMSCIQPA
jgi:hypothetical protein